MSIALTIVEDMKNRIRRVCAEDIRNVSPNPNRQRNLKYFSTGLF